MTVLLADLHCALGQAVLGPLATAVALDKVILLAAVLFAVGIAGVTSRRNILIMLLSVEIMLNAANLALVAFGKVHGDSTGQVFVFFAMTVAAAEVSVGLAIVVAVYRLRRTTDVAEAAALHEVDYGPVPYPQLEGKPAPHHHHEEADDASATDVPEPAGTAVAGEEA